MLTNQEFVLMLREMADYIEKLEIEWPGKIPGPDWWNSSSNRWQFQASSKEQIRTYAQIFGGHFKKDPTDDYLRLVKKLNTCEIEAWALRDRVCHWTYADWQIEDALFAVAGDKAVQQRWPEVAKLFGDLAGCLRQVVRDMDSELNGDTVIEDDRAFSVLSIGQVLEAAQAIQGRQK